VPNINATAIGSDPTNICKIADALVPEATDKEVPEMAMISSEIKLNIADRMTIVRDIIPLLWMGWDWRLNAVQFRYKMMAINTSRVNIIAMEQLTVNPVIIGAILEVRWQYIPVSSR